MDAYRADQKLKKDYYELLNQLLDSIAVIINDNYKETYKVTFSKGYNFLIAFPPQVYELLRRFGPKYQDLVNTKAEEAANSVK